MGQQGPLGAEKSKTLFLKPNDPRPRGMQPPLPWCANHSLSTIWSPSRAAHYLSPPCRHSFTFSVLSPPGFSSAAAQNTPAVSRATYRALSTNISVHGHNPVGLANQPFALVDEPHQLVQPRRCAIPKLPGTNPRNRMVAHAFTNQTLWALTAFPGHRSEHCRLPQSGVRLPLTRGRRQLLQCVPDQLRPLHQLGFFPLCV